VRLSDVMSHSGLSGYAVAALLLFLFAFVLIVVRVFWPSRREEIERDRFLPLDDEAGGRKGKSR
jgi:cbb3-type cytochrome oxidase subunit 3